jgi:hypothetical protein
MKFTCWSEGVTMVNSKLRLRLDWGLTRQYNSTTHQNHFLWRLQPPQCIQWPGASYLDQASEWKFERVDGAGAVEVSLGWFFEGDFSKNPLSLHLEKKIPTGHVQGIQAAQFTGY